MSCSRPRSAICVHQPKSSVCNGKRFCNGNDFAQQGWMRVLQGPQHRTYWSTGPRAAQFCQQVVARAQGLLKRRAQGSRTARPALYPQLLPSSPCAVLVAYFEKRPWMPRLLLTFWVLGASERHRATASTAAPLSVSSWAPKVWDSSNQWLLFKLC